MILAMMINYYYDFCYNYKNSELTYTTFVPHSSLKPDEELLQNFAYFLLSSSCKW